LQCIACKNSGRFVEGFMTGGLSSAKIIIIHRRKIIMHQREGMNQFHGTGRYIEDFLTGGEGVSRRIDQCGAVSFAGPDAGIAHRLMKKGRGDACGRYQALKALVNALTPS
jgi:hypothetical protein